MAAGVSRRELFQYLTANASLAGALSVCASQLAADPLGFPIGCQTYPVRKMIAHDLPATIRQLTAAGFQAIELCSPVGYADAGFGGLEKYSGSDLRKLLEGLNVKCQSSHFDINELRKDLPGRLGWARDMGLSQMMVPSLDGPKNPSLDDVKRAGDEYNKMGEQTSRAGI